MKKLYISFLFVGSLFSVDPAVEYSLVNQLHNVQGQLAALRQRITSLNSIVIDFGRSVSSIVVQNQNRDQVVNNLNLQVDAISNQLDSLAQWIQSEAVVSDFMKERIAIVEKRATLIEDHLKKNDKFYHDDIKDFEGSAHGDIARLHSKISKIKSSHNKILKILKQRGKKFKHSDATELRAQKTRQFKAEVFNPALALSRFKNS